MSKPSMSTSFEDVLRSLDEYYEELANSLEISTVNARLLAQARTRDGDIFIVSHRHATIRQAKAIVDTNLDELQSKIKDPQEREDEAVDRTIDQIAANSFTGTLLSGKLYDKARMDVARARAYEDDPPVGIKDLAPPCRGTVAGKKCSNRFFTLRLEQVRSPDEPMTEFITCTRCGTVTTR